MDGTSSGIACLAKYIDAADIDGSQEGYCNALWDGVNCWSPAAPGSVAYLPCPAAKGMDVSKSAFRICSDTGKWLNKSGFADDRGWTNYTPCFTPEILGVIQRLLSGSPDEVSAKIGIARGTRILELVGLSLSLAALLVSLFIFYYFRSLRNPRTRLHRHLFIAVVIQVAVRLTLYIDQYAVRSLSFPVDAAGGGDDFENGGGGSAAAEGFGGRDARGIDNTPILCESAYICLEYARTAMYMWMFVEGLYLHNMITVTVFEETMSPMIYRIIGWVVPIPLTVAWAIVTAKHYGGGANCWWGYNFTLYFWILEGPRLGVLVINLTFLLNILRVLITKLRQSNSSETLQALKAVKAALVLLPLLGLTNLLNMLDAPLERSAFVFGIWSYTTHALTSCQGLLLAFLYCFCNGEVQIALKKFVRYRLCNNSERRNRGRSVVSSRGDGASISKSLMLQTKSPNKNKPIKLIRLGGTTNTAATNVKMAKLLTTSGVYYDPCNKVDHHNHEVELQIPEKVSTESMDSSASSVSSENQREVPIHFSSDSDDLSSAGRAEVERIVDDDNVPKVD